MHKYIVGAAALALASTAIAMNGGARAVTEEIAAPSGRYLIDSPHSQVVFSIMHLDLSPYFGRFGTVSGSLEFDAKDPAKSSVTVEIDPASVNTPSDKLNNELRGADVLNVGSFAKASFVSTAIKTTGANTGDITGNLTLRGVTKPVTLHATLHGAKPNMGGKGHRLGFSAKARIKRSDYGMTAMRWAPMVADDIDLMIEAEFVQDIK